MLERNKKKTTQAVEHSPHQFRKGGYIGADRMTTPPHATQGHSPYLGKYLLALHMASLLNQGKQQGVGPGHT
eukprot:1153013-Pelagomonas_calceolata.AAC.4